MAFVKDDITDYECIYLNKIGVRDMFGKRIDTYGEEFVVDRENNYYLIGQGHTNINRDGREIDFFALCINNQVLNMKVIENSTGSARDYTFECHWDIEKIKFPAGWTYEKISKNKLIDIITKAFTVVTYSKRLTPERTKALTITVSALLNE